MVASIPSRRPALCEMRFGRGKALFAVVYESPRWLVLLRFSPARARFVDEPLRVPVGEVGPRWFPDDPLSVLHKRSEGSGSAREVRGTDRKRCLEESAEFLEGKHAWPP